jgi:Orn/Lys/Arg decarboxylase, major domain
MASGAALEKRPAMKLRARENRAQQASEAIFRDDLDNSVLELGDLLVHEGPALRAQQEAAAIFGAAAKELTALKIAAMADERPIAVIVRRVMRASSPTSPKLNRRLSNSIGSLGAGPSNFSPTATG